MNFKHCLKIILLNLLSFKGKSKSLLSLFFIFSIFNFDITKAENNNLTNSKNNQIKIEFLDSKNELEDYILDTGDVLSIDFQFELFNGFYQVNEEGELLLPEINETYVRGLTTSELRKLLNKRYKEYLIDSQINVRIAIFKSLRVLVNGELRYPGFIQFPSYKSGSNLISKDIIDFDELLEYNNNRLNIYKNFKKEQDLNNESYKYLINEPNNKSYESNNKSYESYKNVVFERFSKNVVTLSDVIRRAGGITSSTDLSKIEIIRNVPIGKGGGKKRATIDFSTYINESDTSNDIRIFDGDILFFPKLSKPNIKQIPKSVLTGLSPKYISVEVSGEIERKGNVRLPLNATLSDAIDLSGPIKPLSGKIIIFRYKNDGTFVKLKISYSAAAKRGSKRNPYLQEDDLISVKDSILGKSTALIKEITTPLIGIYSTKELIDGFND